MDVKDVGKCQDMSIDVYQGDYKIMKIEKLHIDQVTPDPGNVRKHSQKNIDAIKASLNRFGQQKPIVCDNKLCVRAGNGTLQAAKELGWTHINVVISELDRADLIAYGIADNRTAELAEWDVEGLQQQLAGLDDDLKTIGFDEIDLEALGLGSNDKPTNPDDEWQGMPDYEQSDMQPNYKIQVNFLDVDGIKQFAQLVGQKITEKTKSINYPEQEKISEDEMIYE